MKMLFGTAGVLLGLLAMTMPASAGKAVLVAEVHTMPPMVMENGSGGLEVTMLRAIADSLDMGLVLNEVSFDKKFDGIKNGIAHVAAGGYTITVAREAEVDFIYPHCEAQLGILIRTQDPQDIINHPELEIRSKVDLKGRKVATLSGSTSEGPLRLVGAKIQGASTIEKTYEMLRKGKVEAVVFDEPALNYFVHTKDGHWASIVGDGFEPQHYGLAVAQGSPLRERITRIVLGWEADGTLRVWRAQYLPSN